jgi:hypothetical protein
LEKDSGVRSLRLLFTVGITLLNSCTDSSATSPDGGESDAALDQQIMSTAASYKTWTQVNAAPDPSAIGAFDVNIYVRGDVSGYEQIHPDFLSTASSLSPGTIIVREVLDASGNVSELTLMAKGTPGYDATLDDWWFGVADPSGNAIVQNGVPELGHLDQCHSCHIPRQSDDYLFGVPSAYQQ